MFNRNKKQLDKIELHLIELLKPDTRIFNIQQTLFNIQGALSDICDAIDMVNIQNGGTNLSTIIQNANREVTKKKRGPTKGVKRGPYKKPKKQTSK